ncbi:MAG: hypothetical protein Q8R37_02995 [Nanoarchaeota archaeon]|nr:hypothetical protein [Nanoarchaeota archaeon]
MGKILTLTMMLGISVASGFAVKELRDDYYGVYEQRMEQRMTLPPAAQRKVDRVRVYYRDRCHEKHFGKIALNAFDTSCLPNYHITPTFYTTSEDQTFAVKAVQEFAKLCSTLNAEKKEMYGIELYSMVRAAFTELNRAEDDKDKILTAYECNPQGVMWYCDGGDFAQRHDGELNCQRSELTPERKESLYRELYLKVRDKDFNNER